MKILEKKSELREMGDQIHKALFPDKEEEEKEWQTIADEMSFRHRMVKK